MITNVIRIKIKIAVSLVIVLLSSQSHAQCILENIIISKGDGWKLVSDYIENDSTFQVKEWVPDNQTKRNRTVLLRIVNFEKSRSQMAMLSDSLYCSVKHSKIFHLAEIDTGTSLQEIKINGERKPDLRFAILPVTAESRYDPKDLMGLLWFINGKTSFHMLSIHISTENFNSSFTDKWTNIFEKAIILPPAISYLVKTVFIFETNGKSKKDSSIVVDFAKAVNGRLKGIYQRFVHEEDIQIGDTDNPSSQSYLHLTLHGKFDSSAIVQVLNRQIDSFDFVFLKGDTAVFNIRKEIDRLQKTSNRPLLLDFQNDSYYAAKRAGEIALVMQKDTLAIKKLLQQIKIPATKTFCFNKGMSTDENLPVSIYLVDKEPLITANELLSCSMQIDERGFPGIIVVLNEMGKEKLATYSRQNIGRMLAILVRGEILSTPIIVSEIPDGSLFLSGGMTMADGYYFLNKLGYPYPAPIKFIGLKKSNESVK